MTEIITSVNKLVNTSLINNRYTSRLFGYDAGWLANGIGLPRPVYSGQEALSPAEIGTKKIPLIEFKDIGKPINTMLS